MLIDAKLVSLLIFILTYILFIVFSKRRTLIAIVSALSLIVLEMISRQKAGDVFAWVFTEAINWNVMGIFVGTLFVADIFMGSKAPAYFAELIVNKSKNTAIAIIMICALTGFISAFVENVATVLIVAPIALALSKKLNINPMNMMIAIAVSSNLQGAATLIGDPPSMLLAGFARMNFFDFFIYQGKPGIFFAVELGAVASTIVLYFIFRRHRGKPQIIAEEKVSSWLPTILLVVLILSLAASSFIDTGFSFLAGIICMIFGLFSAVWAFFTKNRGDFLKGFKALDWDTTFFLISVFVIVSSLAANGWIEVISLQLANLVGDNIFLGFTLIVIISILISAFIDNVPYLATMLPVAISLSDHLHINPALFLFGLLIGASLGGNITPIGASANIVACGLLKKEGIKVSFWDFMKIGIPFTLAAVGAAYLFIWFVWK